MSSIQILRTSASALLLASALGAGSLAAAELPQHPDKITYKAFTYTPPGAKDYRTVLKSGPVVYIAEDHELPLVNVSITLRNGAYLTPPGKEEIGRAHV